MALTSDQNNKLEVLHQSLAIHQSINQ